MISSLACLIPVIPIVFHMAIQAFGTRRLRAVTENINGIIKSRSDLDQVRNAIQTNLFLGIPIVCNCILMLASFYWCGSNSFMLKLLYVALLASAQVVNWRIGRPVEKRFKALPVESQDAEIAEEYQHYLEQWSGAHLFLKPPKRAEG
jgi:uncharacterized membrane protein